MGRDLITIEVADDTAPCVCGSCTWRGLASDLREVEGAILTAGDPSPAGRCPDDDCGALAYLNAPIDRARNEAVDMAVILRALCDPTAGETAFRAALDEGRALLARLNA